MRGALRCLGWIVSALLVFLFSLVLAAWFLLQGSLAQLDGERVLPGLEGTVEVERDSLGRVSIAAENRLDVARALGFLHAQDRYFQMDLTRRSAAGELAELFGESLLEFDRDRRIHQARRRMEMLWREFDEEDRALLQAYADGVNHGLKSLTSWPWPYLVLRSRPRAWEPVDSLLTGFAMALDLQDHKGDLDRLKGLAREHMPDSIYSFLMEHPSQLSAPMDGSMRPAPGMPASSDWRRWIQGAEPTAQNNLKADRLPFGSNAWAVGPGATRDGRALVSFDMHLRNQVPNTWYSARWTYPVGGENVELLGLTLPGLPLLIAGSNGRIAWGFTNAYIDLTDLVELELSSDRRNYHSAEGWETIRIETEVIQVSGRSADVFPIRLTRWGPILPGDPGNGKVYALKWAGHQPDFLNLQLRLLETSRNLQDAFARADKVRMPSQNLVLADSAGNIGWRLIGGVIERRQGDGRFPVRSAESATIWEGIRSMNLPSIVNPYGGRVWTANSVASIEPGYTSLGGGGFQVDGRSQMIRDALNSRDDWNERLSADLQLDVGSVVMQRWQELFLNALDERALQERPSRNRLREILISYEGGARADSVAYLLVWTARERLGQGILKRLFDPLRRLDNHLDFRFYRWEEPIYRLVSEQPSGASDPEYSSWRAEILRALDVSVERLEMDHGSLQNAQWGHFNRTEVRHPLSVTFPFLSRLLDMPDEPMPGDRFAIRTQRQSLGQSQRLTVSPGQEGDGFLNMPGGASEHFLSPFYRAGHNEWVEGTHLPLLPGRPLHQLNLLPADRD